MLDVLRQWLHDRKPDAYVQRRQYVLNFGRPLQEDDPHTFNEKLHWLMRHDRRPVLTQCADKYAVREYVKDRIGADYLAKLYGAWTHPRAIPFDLLPARAVLKVTHGSGQNIFLSGGVEPSRVRQQLALWLQRSNYWLWREWAYKDIPPRIIAEEWLGDGMQSPSDYKFWCFDGEPRLIQVDTDRFTQHHRDFYDLTWTALPFGVTYPSSACPPSRPQALDEMVCIAARLSQGHPFVRVDLYALPERVVFGEMTWYPGGASEHFMPECWDATVGGWLRLPQRS